MCSRKSNFKTIDPLGILAQGIANSSPLWDTIVNLYSQSYEDTSFLRNISSRQKTLECGMTIVHPYPCLTTHTRLI